MARTTDWENRIGRRVTLRDLHILSTVVRWGSMAKAASHLAMSQSAVSESILHLESAIRVRLLDRTPQGIEPTIYVETLLKRGHVVFDELQQAIEDIEFLANPTVGEVRIASNCIRPSAAGQGATCLIPGKLWRRWSLGMAPTSMRRRSLNSSVSSLSNSPTSALISCAVYSIGRSASDAMQQPLRSIAGAMMPVGVEQSKINGL
jgi:Bacterial regulatory helix-turn-helix protein, lysR family